MIGKISRRKFIEGSSQMAASLAIGSAASKLFAADSKNTKKGVLVEIPRPIQVVIDDVGWWSGEDGHEKQEPFRTGINRNHVPADYQAIVDLGQALNIRPQAAMVMCEWDKENILQYLPNSTWMGAKWDNKKWVGPWLEEAAEIIQNNKKYFEFTIHGIGHEYWSHGKFTRAEWADKSGIMRDREQVEAHLDFFEKLINQHNLGPFPTSFVPTAFCHSFGISDGHNVSMAQVLKRRGVNYINTPFEDMSHAERVAHGMFGIDDGVITVDRGRDLLSWQSIGELPEGEIKGPTCGLHWPNLLHPDPERNRDIVTGWIDFLKPYDEKLDTHLAPNSEFFRHQLVHHRYTTLKISENMIHLDFAGVDKLDSSAGKKDFILKIESPIELQFESENVAIDSQIKMRTKGSIRYTLKITRLPGRKVAQLSFRSKV